MSRTYRNSWRVKDYRHDCDVAGSYWVWLGRLRLMPPPYTLNYLRRDGCGKGWGFEYWGRRPCGGWAPGRATKRWTHRLERRAADRDLAALIEEAENLDRIDAEIMADMEEEAADECCDWDRSRFTAYDDDDERWW